MTTSPFLPISAQGLPAVIVAGHFDPQITPVPSTGATPEEWTSYSTGQAGQAQITRINSIHNSKFKTQNYPSRVVGGDVAEDLFERGLCLPSGTAMINSDMDRVIETILNCKR